MFVGYQTAVHYIMPDKKQLEELVQFIRAHRNSEGHFETLYNKRTEARQTAQVNGSAGDRYATALEEAATTYADVYRKSKAEGGSAWPEFETFVSHFEKAVIKALQTA